VIDFFEKFNQAELNPQKNPHDNSNHDDNASSSNDPSDDDDE
jgi:hypothetical protein